MVGGIEAPYRRGPPPARPSTRRWSEAAGRHALDLQPKDVLAFTVAGRDKEATRLLEGLEWTVERGRGVNVI
jgi:hypothetical protein